MCTSGGQVRGERDGPLVRAEPDHLDRVDIMENTAIQILEEIEKTNPGLYQTSRWQR